MAIMVIFGSSVYFPQKIQISSRPAILALVLGPMLESPSPVSAHVRGQRCVIFLDSPAPTSHSSRHIQISFALLASSLMPLE